MHDPAARADVSVVVVAHGGEHGLPATVRSVLAALDHAVRGGGRRVAGTTWLRGERLHGEVLLVVRDVALLGPDVPTADERVRVVAAPGVGEGRGRNLAVAAARGRYLLFTDPEVRVPAGWVLAMTEPLRTGQADLVGGAVRLADAHARAWLTPAVAAAYLDVVPDPPEPARAFSGVSMGATRSVLEAVGFDEALGTERLPYGGDVVFRRDVVGAGFREHLVGGAAVERRFGRAELTRRALLARARAHGRGAAYVDRHLRDVRPALGAELLRLTGRALQVALLGGGRGRAERRLDAQAALAYHRAMLGLLRAPYRERPRSAAGDVPGGAGAPRAVEPVSLVSRSDVVPTDLPPVGEPEAADAPRADAGDGPRGSVYQFWARGGSRAAVARLHPAATPVADRLHGSTAS
ncbi:glycosyltransferase family 2 protein [Cellulomonas sp. Marseille-Q8402]